MATRNVPGTYNTIQAGINAAANGDTVLVAAGTYKEKVTINKAITVQTTAGAKIQSTGTIVRITAAATLDGFTVERPNWESARNDLVEITSNGATVKNCTVYITNVPNLAAAKNAFGKEKASGIILKANNIKVENCEVWGANFGVACSDNNGRNSVIRNCNLHNTIQSCIRINHNSKQVRGLLIEGCNINYSYAEDGIQFMQSFDDKCGDDPTKKGYDGIPNRGTIVRNCWFIGNGENSIDYKGGYQIVVEGCFFTRTYGKNDGYVLEGGSISGTVGKGRNARCQEIIMRNNVCWNSANGFRLPGPSCKYYNNTFISNNFGRSGYGIGQDASGSCKNMNANNGGAVNNLCANNRGGQISWQENNGRIDYNLYCTQQGTFKWKGGAKDWNGWTASLRGAGIDGADSHSKHYGAWSSVLLENCPANPAGITGDDDVGTYNFNPKTTSPAYQAGGPLTSCASAGNSNKIPVKDATWFCDGYGAPGVKGDTITINSKVGPVTATITAINGNTLTVNKTVNFDSGSAVFWGASNQPHIGIIDLQNQGPSDPDPEPTGDITANFSADAARVETGTTVNFTDTSTATNTITAWSWKVDGVEFATTENPSRAFNTAGTFDVSLTVTSIDGSDTLTRSDYIEVYAPPADDYINADFTASQTSGLTPLTVTFTDASTSSATVTGWVWKVDGVQFSTSQNPSYTFTRPGSYTIALEATSSVGTSALAVADYISVNDPPDPPTGGEQITNSNFGDGTASWSFYTAGSAAFDANDGTAILNVNSTGGNTQLYQSGLQFVAGTEYTLSITARCASGTVPFRARAMLHGSPYTVYLSDADTITTTNQTFSTTGTISESTSNGRVTLLIDSPGVLYIDRISLTTDTDTPPTPTPTASSVAEVIMVACNTSTGNQTITLSNGLTPTAAMFIVTPAYSGNNPGAGDAMSIGFATSGGAQTAGGYSSADNSGSTDTYRRTRTDACATIPTFGATTEQLRFSIVSMALNQIVINIDTAPAQAYQIEVHAYEATEAAIGWDAPSTTDEGTVTAESGMAGTPDLLLAWTPGYNTNTYPANANNDVETCFGVSDGTNSYAMTRRLKDNQASGSVWSYAASGYIFMRDSSNAAAAEFDATGWVMRTKETAGSWNGTVGWMALRFASNTAKVFAGSIPATSGTSLYNIGQSSGYVGALATTHDSLTVGSTKGAWSVGGWDGSTEVSIGVSSEHLADPTQTTTRYNTAALIDLPDEDGTDGKDGSANGNSGNSLSVTWTNTETVSTPNVFFWSIDGAAGGGGGAGDDLIETGLRAGLKKGLY